MSSILGLHSESSTESESINAVDDKEIFEWSIATYTSSHQ